MSSVSAATTRNPMPLSEFSQCMPRVVRWFCDENRPILHKICAVVLGMLGWIGTGLLLGHPFLASLALLPIGFWALRERSLLSTQPPAEGPVDRPPSLQNPTAVPETPREEARRRVIDALGGLEVLSRLPMIFIGGLSFDGSSLSPRDLAHSAMRYSARLSDDGIALKVRDANQGGREVVISFFPVHPSYAPQYGALDSWAHSIDGEVFPAVGGFTEATLLRQIFVERNHPRYTLC